MQMDIKQKTLLVLTIGAFSYLGYQVYDMMKNDMDSPPPVAHSAPHYSSGPVQTANAAVRTSTPTAAVALPTPPPEMHQAPLATSQKAYLHMVNQYELAKMKRRLLEERAAIAAAQQRIASLNKQTHDIDASLAGTSDTFDD
ncbi:MAG: hypothetical protein KDH94_01920, partial [Coxiellaceae bacterium]|nr:hypothetical protein [Coxiellaceae bacterium]